MGWQTSIFFKTICRIVLLTFYIQNLHIINLGYGQGDWAIGFKSAMAADIPAPVTVSPMFEQNAKPVKLQAKSIAPNDYFSPTPDANSADPYIIQKATELNHDPARIFAFVRDEIGYESYKGSLRGARGTLWSKAGNSLDQASLLIALLRASNIQARYVQGTLPNTLAQQLILSMFPKELRVSGFINDGVERSDPANDARLLEETREHYWVDVNLGSSFQAADPTFKEAAINQTFTAPETTFNEVPDNLRHKVTLRLKREITNLLTGLFGIPAQDMKTVLEQTFITASMTGKPLSLGHFVNQSAFGFVLSATTNTYSPYIELGDEAQPMNQDELIRGEDYQEVLTNFPLGSQILTGVFLEMDVITPGQPLETLERTLLDKIGFEVRKNGGQVNQAVDASGLPAISDLDIVTVDISTGAHYADATKLFDDLKQNSERQAQFNGMTNIPAEAITLLRQSMLGLTRLIDLDFLRLSDLRTSQLVNSPLIRAYYDHPRLILIASLVKFDKTQNTASLSHNIDLRKDTIRTTAPLNQTVASTKAFNALYGVSENITERDALSRIGSGVYNTVNIFETALSKQINLVVVTKKNLNDLDSLGISLQAKSRITSTVSAGHTVIVPEQSVDGSAGAVIGWYDIDPTTGEAIGVTEEGLHGVFEFTAVHLLIVGIIAVVGGGLYLALQCEVKKFSCKTIADSATTFGIRTATDAEYKDCVIAAKIPLCNP